VPPVTAVVLTYRRPGLATRVVRGLLEAEGLPASQVVLVINGEGGLDDPGLEAAVTVLRLRENLGPAGGFARGFAFARQTSNLPWIYACEDDASLLDLPSPRLRRLIERVEAHERLSPGAPIGVVGTIGWDLDLGTGRTSRHEVAFPHEPFEEVGFGAWGCTLLSRRVLDAGIYPDESLFWWAEELDFCLRARQAGFRVLVDVDAELRPKLPSPTRLDRPERVDEPWCSYYAARNGFILQRRFGDARWTLWHLLKSARRFQLAPSRAHRTAILRGLMDGSLGRTGRHPAFVRRVGEW
jgi:GT2 family glycosyltransferase